jgi:hypothetical protein
LWVSIRFAPRESLRFGNISFAKRTEWTTSCKFTVSAAPTQMVYAIGLSRA